MSYPCGTFLLSPQTFYVVFYFVLRVDFFWYWILIVFFLVWNLFSSVLNPIYSFKIYAHMVLCYRTRILQNLIIYRKYMNYMLCTVDESPLSLYMRTVGERYAQNINNLKKYIYNNNFCWVFDREYKMNICVDYTRGGGRRRQNIMYITHSQKIIKWW